MKLLRTLRFNFYFCVDHRDEATMARRFATVLDFMIHFTLLSLSLCSLFSNILTRVRNIKSMSRLLIIAAKSNPFSKHKILPNIFGTKTICRIVSRIFPIEKCYTQVDLQIIIIALIAAPNKLANTEKLFVRIKKMVSHLQKS